MALRAACVAGAFLGLGAVAANVTLHRKQKSFSTHAPSEQTKCDTHYTRAVVALRALDAVAGQMADTAARVAVRKKYVK